MVDICPNEHSMVNFSISYPFKGARAGHVRLFCFGASSANWVDAEWDSPSTESMRSETPRQLSQSGVRLHVNWVNAGGGTNIYEDFIIPRWLSWPGVSLRVDSVDVESHLALTQLTGMRLGINWVTAECKKIRISLWIQEPKWKQSKALLFDLRVYMFDQCKNLNKKISCKCTFKPSIGIPASLDQFGTAGHRLAYYCPTS